MPQMIFYFHIQSNRLNYTGLPISTTLIIHFDQFWHQIMHKKKKKKKKKNEKKKNENSPRQKF